ncbi:MAG: DUF438 domain-containing protein [Candidatus Marinimicrobia bacterium]|nr:DUF438 domain-containing protein [Candidatus Neomarinimicrobiota bacterium]
MSELINNSEQRKEKLKDLILRLHDGESMESVRRELMRSLQQIPYGQVIEVEQELISEGLPEDEILQLCDAHSAVLEGNVDLTGIKDIPEGHPVDIMQQENRELRKVTAQARSVLSRVGSEMSIHFPDLLLELRGLFNQLHDVDKHYQRKEYLLFPYLEQEGITGPPKVMWGKHDEIREQLKGSLEVLETDDIDAEELLAATEIMLEPTLQAIDDMTIKEEDILFPMALDTLHEGDWYEINQQSLEIGFCLYDPDTLWQPEWAGEKNINQVQKSSDYIQLPSGGFTPEELMTILNTLPVDLTFVDKDDKVKYFSQSEERIFQRNRAILNRDVRHCHPPASAHIVDKILNDFKEGQETRAPFWIQLGEKFIHIEYFALRDADGEYLGTLEVSQNLTEKRALEGEQRILSYAGENGHE